MTGAAGFFPWSFGSGSKVQETKTADAEQTDETPNVGETICPTAFDLIELHSHWFGDDSKPAETIPTQNNGAVATPIERNTPAHEQEPVVYRIIKSDQMAPLDTELREGKQTDTQVSHDETIAETLAHAEQVLQQTPELPQHSRLRASLSALEAALAGTDLSDLEAALAGQEAPQKQRASS